jgi:hypothetical protein
MVSTCQDAEDVSATAVSGAACYTRSQAFVMAQSARNPAAPIMR